MSDKTEPTDQPEAAHEKPEPPAAVPKLNRPLPPANLGLNRSQVAGAAAFRVGLM